MPGQALPLEQAFAAYTRGSAFMNHRDDTGHLQVGMRADLAVLDRNRFTWPSQEIGKTVVVATYIAGEPRYTT